MIRLILVAGARPNFMKIAPLMTRARGADGFRRHPGGDDDPRNAVPDASGEHGAAGDSRDGHEPAGGVRPGEDTKGVSGGDRGALPHPEFRGQAPVRRLCGMAGLPKESPIF